MGNTFHAIYEANNHINSFVFSCNGFGLLDAKTSLYMRYAIYEAVNNATRNKPKYDIEDPRYVLVEISSAWLAKLNGKNN